MHAEFWLERWKNQQIAFHGAQVHPLLVRHLDALALRPNASVFVPLCGKTLDIHWLLARGLRVAGAELSRIAVEALFSELGIAPTISEAGPVTRFHGPAIDVFVGDVFELSRELLGEVDAIYDRAALVALPSPMRERYTAHLVELTRGAPQLLITFDYDPTAMEGPPFAVAGHELEARYGQAYEATLLERVAVEGGLKGIAATENAWWLRAR